jgi:predicted unusual protein kinase regulating ubiquinone biosynthesis (AarF/ABC1/UbiB family)
MSKGVPTGFFRRSRSVLALTAGVAGHELRHQLQARIASSDAFKLSEVRARVEQAKLIAESLGRLKGAFMKAGQLLSIDASDLLPPEATAILSALQGKAEPIDFAIIKDVLERELGAERLGQLDDLDPMPAASASIGQVHRARAFGVPVAVKVQYPGVAASIDDDVALLEKLARSWLAFSPREIDLAATFDELRSVLHLEADYLREREYLERYGALVASDARFEVPRAIPSLCTSRVLTMSWAQGMPLGEWLACDPPRADRVHFAKAMLDLYCLEFFQWGVVQTDPNFGNFLIRPNEPTIVLLDFGATLEYDAEFRARYVDLLRSVATGSAQKVIDAGIAFELIDARESRDTQQLFVDMLMSAAEPFGRHLQPFDFGSTDYAVRSQNVVKRFVASLRFSPPPRHLIFLHRKLGGLFQLLRRLDIAMDLSPYWEQMLGVPNPLVPSTEALVAS